MVAPNTSSLDDPHQRWHSKQSNLFHCFLSTMKRFLKTYLQSFHAIHGVRLALALLRSTFFYVFQALKVCFFLGIVSGEMLVLFDAQRFPFENTSQNSWFFHIAHQHTSLIQDTNSLHHFIICPETLLFRSIKKIATTRWLHKHRRWTSYRSESQDKTPGFPASSKSARPKFSLPNKTRKLVPGPIQFCWTYLKW